MGRPQRCCSGECECSRGRLFTRFSTISASMAGGPFGTPNINRVNTYSCSIGADVFHCDMVDNWTASYDVYYPLLVISGAACSVPRDPLLRTPGRYIPTTFNIYPGTKCYSDEPADPHTYSRTWGPSIYGFVGQRCDSNKKIYYEWWAAMGYTIQSINDSCNNYPTHWFDITTDFAGWSHNGSGDGFFTIAENRYEDWPIVGSNSMITSIATYSSTPNDLGSFWQVPRVSIGCYYRGTTYDVNAIPTTFNLSPKFNILGVTATVTFS